MEDFQRQVVKSDTATFRIENIDLEIPSGLGQFTNVEGIISPVMINLQDGQEARKQEYPELYEKIEGVVQQLTGILKGESFPFKVSIDDPAGNSWIEPSTTDSGSKYVRSDYPRTQQQNEALGIGINGDEEDSSVARESAQNESQQAADVTEVDPLSDVDILAGKVYSLPSQCPGCTRPCTINMQMVNIPHFKEVIIMSTTCDQCGYRSSEVKTGGEVPEKGRVITLKVNNETDLHRDILKSESCELSVPELELHVHPGTLGGRFTTVEGLLTQVRDQLHGQIYDTEDDASKGGDSMAENDQSKWGKFFAQLNTALKSEIQFTVILKDPLASSYVQDLCEPEPDPQIEIEDYTRSAEEEDELGLTDMKTENYAEEEEAEGGDDGAATTPKE